MEAVKVLLDTWDTWYKVLSENRIGANIYLVIHNNEFENSGVLVSTKETSIEDIFETLTNPGSKVFPYDRFIFQKQRLEKYKWTNYTLYCDISEKQLRRHVIALKGDEVPMTFSYNKKKLLSQGYELVRVTYSNNYSEWVYRLKEDEVWIGEL